MTKQITRAEAMELLNTLTDDCLSMTDWQREFIDSCVERKKSGDFFSRKQLDIIEEIFKEYVI